MKPKKINDFSYEIEQTGDMNTSVKIFASEVLMNALEKDKAIQQGINVACLPGIRGNSLMMPDAHQGYGFSIGGVAAFSMKDGIISPGGVGFDINCGVRLVATNLTRSEVEPHIQTILQQLFDAIPTGKGFENKVGLSEDELDALLKNGPSELVKQGIGTEEDLQFCEAKGCMSDAEPMFISRQAKSRGRRQLGTLGAGNHFLEIQIVEDILDEKTASVFGLTKKDQVVFMIHCGSRGLGHQVASDYLRKMEDAYPDIIEALPEKDLIYAPIQSDLAKEYYGAMCASANFAWANRHMIAHQTKQIFLKSFSHAEFRTVYDVAHNIAKKETHLIDGVLEEVMVHRKGATRAFGPNSVDLAEQYVQTGQPVILPGSMGTGSYVLVGTKEAMTTSFGSTAHGAGRLLSRFEAKKQFDGLKIQQELQDNHIAIKVRNIHGVADEAPGAYKDVDEVVRVSHLAKIGNIVVKLKPLGVIKG